MINPLELELDQGPQPRELTASEMPVTDTTEVSVAALLGCHSIDNDEYAPIRERGKRMTDSKLLFAFAMKLNLVCEALEELNFEVPDTIGKLREAQGELAWFSCLNRQEEARNA